MIPDYCEECQYNDKFGCCKLLKFSDEHKQCGFGENGFFKKGEFRGAKGV